MIRTHALIVRPTTLGLDRYAVFITRTGDASNIRSNDFNETRAAQVPRPR